MQIKELTDQDNQRWDAYVEQAPEATFFHRAGWRHVLQLAFGHQAHFLFAEVEGEIKGIVPLGHVRSRVFGNTLSSTPFCVYGGVVADSSEIREALENTLSIVHSN